jgi:hypothetical protein
MKLQLHFISAPEIPALGMCYTYVPETRRRKCVFDVIHCSLAQKTMTKTRGSGREMVDLTGNSANHDTIQL